MPPRILLLRIGLIAVVSIAACAAPKSGAQLASDALSRGLQAHAAGRLEEATTAYFEVLRYDTRNKFAFYNLGQLAHTTKRPVAAESYYRLALEVDPNFNPAVFNLAILRADAGATQEAISLYQRVLATEPDNAAAHFNLGFLLRSIGQQEEGDAEIARAVRLNPGLGVPPASSPTPIPVRTP